MEDKIYRGKLSENGGKCFLYIKPKYSLIYIVFTDKLLFFFLWHLQSKWLEIMYIN